MGPNAPERNISAEGEPIPVHQIACWRSEYAIVGRFELEYDRNVSRVGAWFYAHIQDFTPEEIAQQGANGLAETYKPEGL